MGKLNNCENKYNWDDNTSLRTTAVRTKDADSKYNSSPEIDFHLGESLSGLTSSVE